MDSHFLVVGSSNLEPSLRRRAQSMSGSLRVFSCPAKRSGAARPSKCSRRWPIHCASPRLPGDDKRANCKWGFLLIRKPDTESLVGSVCQDPRELPDGISLIAAEMGGSTSVFIGIRRAV